MKFSVLYLLSLLWLVMACQPTTDTDKATTATEEQVKQETDPAQKLIIAFVEAMGGMDVYRKLEDVTYNYATKGDRGMTISSQERYLYPSEWSWASYPEASNPNNKDEKGELIQAYVDDNVWVSFNGEQVTDTTALKRARFSRKTNFYWLNMFFKMQDPGLTYQLGDMRKVDGQDYETVKVGFDDNIGDAKDVYLLYVNTETKLVDYFLFTVMEFGRTEPIMMKVKYEEVGGLLWPTFRASTKSNWEGEVAEDAKWSEKHLLDLKVNTKFDRDIFNYPG